jgi:hypothetical protein
VFGAVVSTVQVEVAGVASTLPAASIARTSNLWLPSASELRLRGEMHAAQAPASVESSRHWNEATPEPPASVPEKVKLAEAEALRAGGPESIEVFGAMVSTVHVDEADVASTFPAWSIARTSNLWEPSANPE